MVKAIIDISEDANKTLTVLKAEYGLKTKSEAINKMAELYLSGEPEVRPEYVRKLLRRKKEAPIYIGTMEDFHRMFTVPAQNRAKTIQETAKTSAMAARRHRK